MVQIVSSKGLNFLHKPRLFILSFVVLLVSGFADAAKKQEEEMSALDYTSRFTVKVINQAVNLFMGGMQGGHGTGFLVDIRVNEKDEKIGVIFTNNHVIEASGRSVIQRLLLQFTTDTDVPETVSAQLVYSSQIHDFAVLEFRISDLKRVAQKIQPAPLPPPRHPLYEFDKNFRALQGRPTMAQGNPLSSSAVTTYGQITGRDVNLVNGTFIQTQTPINPGNSGGPLIDLETGMVIGVNTLKITDADNMGFSIPIAPLIEEYQFWRSKKGQVRFKNNMVRWGVVPGTELQVTGVDTVIRKKFPKFFEQSEHVLRVLDSDPSTGLLSGDHVISLNGAMLKASIYEVKKQVLFSDRVVVGLVREGQYVEVEMKPTDLTYFKKRSDLDYTYISGLHFVEMDSVTKWFTDKAMSSAVIIDTVLPTFEMNFGSYKIPNVGSILVKVELDGTAFEIKTIFDLRQALKAVPKAKFIKLTVREPVMVETEEGAVMPAQSRLGTIVYQPNNSSYLIPLIEVYTPNEFSKHKFQKQFSFKEGEPDKRVWRWHVKPSYNCERFLKP